jgi:hypothetical protein
VYVGPDHTHSHGNFGDEGGLHNASDIDGLEEFLEPAVLDHGAMGASEDFDFTDSKDHEGEVDANLTVTLSGATSGEAAFMTLKLTQDSGGGNTLTLPGSVVNGSDVETAFDLTADAVNIITVFSYDGGTTWYAFLAGASGGAALSDATPLVEAGAGDPGVGTEASRDDHVHPAASSSGGIGEILISDTPSTPLVFADLIQNEAQDDLVYADP